MAMTSGAIGVAFAVSPIVGAFQDIIPGINGRLIYGIG